MAQKIHQILSASKGHSLPTDINGLYLPAHRQNLLLDVVEYCIGVRRQRLSVTPWVSSLKELLCLSSLSKDRVFSCLSPPFNKLHYFLQSWEPLPSLNWKDSSVSLNCTTTGSSFLDIIAKFQVFISWEQSAISNASCPLSLHAVVQYVAGNNIKGPSPRKFHADGISAVFSHNYGCWFLSIFFYLFAIMTLKNKNTETH